MPAAAFYLETSVWGSVAGRQPRDRREVVVRLLRLLDGVSGTCVISDVVFREIRNAPSQEAERIQMSIDRVRPAVHPVTGEMEQLAKAYLLAGVLPKKREADSLHVAAATCLRLDYLVSWNHRHMTRPMKRVQYESVNRLHGYLKTPLICNPFEACDELRNR